MRTTRELRQQTGAAVPTNPDSEYKPVVRKEKVMPEIRIPSKLQKDLPFNLQEKTRAMVEEKRKRERESRKQMRFRRNWLWTMKIARSEYEK